MQNTSNMHDSRFCLSGGDVLGRDVEFRLKMHDSRSCLSGGNVLGRGEVDMCFTLIMLSLVITRFKSPSSQWLVRQVEDDWHQEHHRKALPHEFRTASLACSCCCCP